MCDKNGISGGEGGSVLGVNFWKIQRAGGVIGKIPSVGGYGYFLELHNTNDDNYCNVISRLHS